MPWTSAHLKWLKKTKLKLSTIDNKNIEVWKFCHQDDPAILSAWAKHFRNHYCRDNEIDNFRKGYGYQRKDYLLKIKFPDNLKTPGPSIRAGDFGEVLVADYLNFVLCYWVPRIRYSEKDIRNESSKGCDVIGFKILGDDISDEDSLAIYEAKTQFSGKSAKPRLQDAINGSALDSLRKAETLNAIKQRLFDKQHLDKAIIVERFQNPADKPYTVYFGAVALFETALIDIELLKEACATDHPFPNALSLVVIHGTDMMKLVHKLYDRAADEA
ncbi:MAG: virulence associated protein [Candidatus Raymondbacteria bacterium RifOxyB12_full_50_8]|nr:MAG: virulence associated protein [Candidatus Raymondbacteria bacterium RifOxyB12_full_50_8]